jgi:hypothetical protein
MPKNEKIRMTLRHLAVDPAPYQRFISGLLISGHSRMVKV